MSRIKLLLDVVEDMRALADSLSTLANAMMDSTPDEEATASTDPAPQPDQPSDDKPALSLVDVRTKLGELSRQGYTAQVRSILERYGVSRLSDANPKDYADILREAEELSNAPA